jgi:hypothetical protein
MNETDNSSKSSTYLSANDASHARPIETVRVAVRSWLQEREGHIAIRRQIDSYVWDKMKQENEKNYHKTKQLHQQN